MYVRELDSLEAKRLPGTEGEFANTNPFFSHDGKWIGFRVPGRGIMRVAIDGGPPLQIAPDPGGSFLSAAWGTDDTIVYSSNGRLWRVSAGGGGTPEPLTPEEGLGPA